MSNDKLGATLHDGDPIDPDCQQGKHRACLGETWDDVYDKTVECGTRVRLRITERSVSFQSVLNSLMWSGHKPDLSPRISPFWGRVR